MEIKTIVKCSDQIKKSIVKDKMAIEYVVDAISTMPIIEKNIVF